MLQLPRDILLSPEGQGKTSLLSHWGSQWAGRRPGKSSVLVYFITILITTALISPLRVRLALYLSGRQVLNSSSSGSTGKGIRHWGVLTGLWCKRVVLLLHFPIWIIECTSTNTNVGTRGTSNRMYMHPESKYSKFRQRLTWDFKGYFFILSIHKLLWNEPWSTSHSFLCFKKLQKF